MSRFWASRYFSLSTGTGGGGADPPACTVTFHIRDQFTDNLAGVPIEITFIRFTADAAVTPPVLSPVQLQTTDATGVVTVDLYRDAEYKAIFGSWPDTRRVDFTVPDAGTYEVGE